MNSANNFNVCPRCGNSNSLNAKFCSRCGAQLKRPDDPVICAKCHTRNSSSANFCRSCGAPLRSGVPTKTCPNCGRDVNVDDKYCACGYQFVAKEHTAEKTQEKVKKQKVVKERKPKVKKEKVSGGVYANKGGRAIAIVALIFVLLFMYLAVAPISMRPAFLSAFDKGVTAVEGEQSYVFDHIADIVSVISTGELASLFQSGAGNIMFLVILLIFSISIVAHLIVCIVRIFTKKRSKKPNWLYLALTILNVIIVGMMFLFSLVHPQEGFFHTVAGWFTLANGGQVGYAALAIPLYYLFFFLYSLGAKSKAMKEETMDGYVDVPPQEYPQY